MLVAVENVLLIPITKEGTYGLELGADGLFVNVLLLRRDMAGAPVGDENLFHPLHDVLTHLLNLLSL